MKFKGQVVGDKIVNRAATRDYDAKISRELLLVDQDDTPLRGLLTVKIELDDPISPWAKDAPILTGSVVILNVIDLNTYDGGKIVAGKGSLLKIEGRMEFKPVPIKQAA